MIKGLLTVLARLCAMLTTATFAAPIARANACDPSSIVSFIGDKRGCCSHHNGVRAVQQDDRDAAMLRRDRQFDVQVRPVTHDRL